MTKAALLDEVRKCMRGADVAFKEFTEASWQEKVNNTPDWEPMPKRGTFYDDVNREKYNDRINTLHKQAADAINSYVKDIAAQAVKAPTEEATRAVQMFSLMEPGTFPPGAYKVKVDDMLNKYGDNPMTYETIRSQAKKGDLHYPEHPTTVARDKAAILAQSVDSFFMHRHAAKGGRGPEVIDGEVGFVLDAIDL